MRIFDLLLSVLLMGVFFIPCILIGLLVKVSSKGEVIHWSKRIGINNKEFLMPKFRTMYIDAPDVATHLLKDSKSYITPIGKFLRKTSLDELPQLWSILKGDMAFVGPRPALFNQHDLIEKRAKVGVDKIKPGVTGLAQISGRDELSIDAKVKVDKEYLDNKSIFLDFKIIFFTFFKVFLGSGIKH